MAALRRPRSGTVTFSGFVTETGTGINLGSNPGATVTSRAAAIVEVYLDRERPFS